MAENMNRYTVRKGDSFYLISHRLGIPLRALLEANAAINPARLMVGDELFIPTEEPGQHIPQEAAPEMATTQPAPPCPESVRVTVADGESIADIQLRHNINLHTLNLANPGQDLTQLTQGQILCVPGANLACALPDTYALQEGECLESVAQKFNLPIAALLRANPCLAPGDFSQGASITLPK
jgi:Membrane proteins related to metalloendopeptidases